MRAICPDSDDCKFSWARISAIVFEPKETKPSTDEKDKPEDKTVKLDCGESR